MSQTFPVYSPYLRLFGSLILLLLVTTTAIAQGTAFTYQGKLTDSGNPANGVYDLQFKLFDTPAVGTGAEHGPILTNPAVQVAAGIFTVTLDFSGGSFSGADRFLEIGVRPAGSPNAYTILSPRQLITSSPYAIQTINAQKLGGLPVNRFVQLDVSGNVGIGTGTPTAKLTVNGSGAFTAPGAARFDLFNTTANAGFLQHVTDGGLLQFATTSGATRMVIDPQGRVGIGTASPSARLTVSGAGAFDAPSAARFDLFNSTAGTGFLEHVTDTGLLQFATTGGATRMVIAANGNVGVGTVTPQAKFQIAGAGTNGYTLGVEGNVTQNLANFGFPKAMIAVNKLGAILRCFNSTIAGIGATAVPCGFIVGNTATGNYFINFGFPVTDRFLMITTEDGASGSDFIIEDAANYRFTANANQIDVFTFESHDAGIFENSPFTIIVF